MWWENYLASIKKKEAKKIGEQNFHWRWRHTWKSNSTFRMSSAIVVYTFDTSLWVKFRTVYVAVAQLFIGTG